MGYEFDLGGYSRPTGTDSSETQRWFDRGLLWLYGFNREEAVSCFREAQRADPNCAMAWWGEAFAAGPFINLPWDWQSEEERRTSLATCVAAADSAMARRERATAVERALIEALPVRYQRRTVVPLEEFAAWDDAFAAAMRGVYRRFPDDSDVAVLFAEALITRTPWQLWDLDTGKPAEGADSVEAQEVLEAAMRQRRDRGQPPHPGMLHIYIHVMEMSRTPEYALAAADQLRGLSPDNGHLDHMPTHIYFQCGRHADALEVSREAATADGKYARHAGPFNFYTTARCHHLHAMMNAGMLLGDYRGADEAARKIDEAVTPELLRQDRPTLVQTLDYFRSGTIHVPVRFGRWHEIVDVPMPPHPELYVTTTLMVHYAKGVAHAALGDFEAADRERSRFDAGCAALPEDRIYANDTARNVMAVAREMLYGEIAYHQGHHEAGFAHLREAVRLNDHLRYSEPWPWMHPPRHALGALLLEQGQLEEAEQVYRADLGLDDGVRRCLQNRENVWSLHGYHECLQRMGRDREAASLAPSLAAALARSDVEIASSCHCRMRVIALRDP
ncbi:MAG: hypothetical protein OXU75_05190 [Deltaproteobacteria bacterium]|nr:hypothetical protein [Deltaproteobacteria bacterium]